ncbi:MAG: hypothetical protein EOO11_17870 [Chitinophagaceae bacterium]|nr:MAG: hypothetical protein EOO11_17870 [Chitinophagaceae bacterium]
MLQLFRTEFSYNSRDYAVLATLRAAGGGGSLLINLPGAQPGPPFLGDNLSIDLEGGLDVPEDCPVPVQELLGVLLAALHAVPGFPPVRLNFGPRALSGVHPVFRGGPLRLLLYVNNQLLDSLQLNVPGITDCEEDAYYLRNAMRTLIDKWEDRLRGRNLELEFRLQHLR